MGFLQPNQLIRFKLSSKRSISSFSPVEVELSVAKEKPPKQLQGQIAIK